MSNTSKLVVEWDKQNIDYKRVVLCLDSAAAAVFFEPLLIILIIKFEILLF